MGKDKRPLIDPEPRQGQSIAVFAHIRCRDLMSQGEVHAALIAHITRNVSSLSQRTLDTFKQDRQLIRRMRRKRLKGRKKQIAVPVLRVEPRGLKKHRITRSRGKRANVLRKSRSMVSCRQDVLRQRQFFHGSPP